MAQYQPSYVDTSGFSKSISDAAYKAQLLAMKQQEAMNRAIDNQFKTYSGKLRKQDAAKFDSYFGEYSDALKNYQRYNRVGGRSSDMMAASELVNEKKQQMLDFIDRSTKLGQVQIGLGKLYKDGGKLLNKSKYNEVYNNLDSYDADQLNELYGGIDKIPTDFELRRDDLNTNKYFNTINSLRKIGNLSSSAIRQPKIDPNTGQQVTRPYSIGEFGQIDVPIMEVKVGLTPAETRNAVWASSVGEFQDAPDLFLKELNEGLASSNQSVQQQSRDLLNRVMSTYGIKDPKQVTGVDILAQSVLDQSQQIIEIEDWSKLKNIEGVIKGRAGLKLSQQRLALARSTFNEAKKNSALKLAGQAGTIVGSYLNSGLIDNKQSLDFLANALVGAGFDVKLDANTIKQLKTAQGLRNIDVAELIAAMKALNQGEIEPQ